MTRKARLTELHIDVNGAKPAVVKEVEVRLGKPWAKIFATAEHQADALWALAYAVGRREDPELTWEEAGEIVVYLESAPVPPTGAAG